MTSSSFRVAALALALGMTAGVYAQGVTRLNIDTSNTGVDLGLQHNPDGTISAKVPAGLRATTLDNGSTTSQTAAGASNAGTATSNGNVTPGALGTNPNDLAPPGTSTLGNPTSAGRQNGNSGTDNGRTTPGVSGGTGIVNSGTTGNGLPAAASGNTGAGPAATGTTGAGSAATGTTGNATSGTAVDAQTAAQAASTSRTVSGTITGARILNGVPGQGLQNGRGMGNLSNGSTSTTNGGTGASTSGASGSGR